MGGRRFSIACGNLSKEDLIWSSRPVPNRLAATGRTAAATGISPAWSLAIKRRMAETLLLLQCARNRVKLANFAE